LSDQSGYLAELQARAHPLRDALSEEMHARRFPDCAGPARAIQTVMVIDADEAVASIRHLERLIGSDAGAVDPDIRHHYARIGGIGLAWERHTEFVTYTLVAPAAEGDPLFDPVPFGELDRWVVDAPGRIIRATRIRVLGASEALPSETALADSFSADDLVISEVADGRARIWTDFRLHDDGFGRLLVADRGLTGGEHRQLVQRIQELGNYRKMALLGLPVARGLMADVTQLEQRLATLTEAVASEQSDDHDALIELSSLSAELARIMATTRYRMAATHAYVELCMDRIRRLAVQPVPGFHSLADFTERRLLPAMRTCDAFSRRLDDLSQRAAWASGLLRTRVDTGIARQNSDLLASMNRRTLLQLRLQQTVEGLSVVAISYYAIGLLGYLFKGFHPFGAALAPETALALAVPVVLGAVWLGIRRIRHSIEK
jgi:uncharacterized membrane-anchored protein